MTDPAAYDRTKNPYAPPRQAEQAEPGEPGDERPAGGVLPVLRLNRLGASRRLVVGMSELWERLDDEQKAATADAMARMDDDELLSSIVGEVPAGTAEEVAAWVAANRFPADAARAAIQAEHAAAAAEGRTVDLAAVDRYARTGG